METNNTDVTLQDGRADVTVREGRIDIAGTLGSVGALLCWSIAPLFIRHLTGYFDSWTQNVYRSLVGCVFLMPYVVVCMRRGSLKRSVWRRAVVPALFNVVMQTLWAMAFYYMKPGIITLIAKSSLIWVFLLSLALFPEERWLVRSPLFWGGMILSTAGVSGVILAGKDVMGRTELTGVAIGLCCAFVWALYIISVRKAFAGIDSVVGYCVMATYTTVGLIVAAFIFSNPLQDLPSSAWPWAAVVISAIVGMSLGHPLFYMSIKRIGVTVPSVVILATPFVVLTLSRFIFNETLSGLQWLFGTVLVAGGALAILSQKQLRR